MINICIIFNLIAFTCLAADPLMLKFEDFSIENSGKNSSLWNLQGQEIQMRGFWYSLSPNEGLLASQPHLKSCCFKAPAKIEQQLLVKGDVTSFSSQRAITVEGIFKIEPIYDSERRLVQLFTLENARQVPESTFSLIGLALVLLLILFAVWRLFFKSRFFSFK